MGFVLLVDHTAHHFYLMYSSLLFILSFNDWLYVRIKYTLLDNTQNKYLSSIKLYLYSDKDLFLGGGVIIDVREQYTLILETIVL